MAQNSGRRPLLFTFNTTSITTTSTIPTPSIIPPSKLAPKPIASTSTKSSSYGISPDFSAATSTSSFSTTSTIPPPPTTTTTPLPTQLSRKSSFSLLSKARSPSAQRRPATTVVTANLSPPSQTLEQRSAITERERSQRERSQSRARSRSRRGSKAQEPSSAPDIFASATGFGALPEPRPPPPQQQLQAAFASRREENNLNLRDREKEKERERERDRERRDSVSSIAPYQAMLPIGPMQMHRELPLRNVTAYHMAASGSYGAPPLMPPGMMMMPSSPTLEHITYQHIQDTASKRISTLDYLRKAHEGTTYWFNTLLYTKPDLTRLPSSFPPRLARRSTNHLLLGLSLPPLLDLHATSATDFLRALNALFAEFEAFQSLHPADGSSGSRMGGMGMGMGGGRMGQMFKRATSGGVGAGGGGAGGKGRRASSAAEIGLPMMPADAHGHGHGHGGGLDTHSTAPSTSTTSSMSTTIFPHSESELHPGEEYTHLLTPSLPFEPDFYETFATLCDVLIDCYTRLMSLLSTPKDCAAPGVAELFTKADGRLRKVIIAGVVKEFEEGTRGGVRGEVGGVGRVVLGGLC